MAASDAVIADVIGYSFADQSILREALRLPGPMVNPDGNKRLALVGDAMAKMVLVTAGYKTGLTRRNEGNWKPRNRSADILTGQIHDLQAARSGNTNLEVVARLHGLDQFIERNPSQRGPMSTATLATTVEAIIGAAYLDGEQRAAECVMRALGLLS